MAMIVLCDEASQAWLDAFAEFLRDHSPEGLPLELAPCCADGERNDEALQRAHVLVAGLVGQCCDIGGELIGQCPELRLVQKVGSRVAGVDVQAARDAGVQASLLPAPAHVACAEHTMLLILALEKKLIAAHRKVVRRPLREKGPAPRKTARGDYAYNWANLDGIGTLAGKTLGLVGMGDIAIEVARRAGAFGLKLVYFDNDRLSAAEEAELGLEHRELDELLKEADIVSLHVGLGPGTENLIDAERLAAMKPTAFLVNTARGGLVDEAALAEALAEGRLAGAALDAWAEEPAPRDNPLLKLENVVATPHIAAGTLPKTALFEAVLPNILAALRGEKVAGSLTPDVAPKPALPPEEPPPPADEPPSEETPEAETPQAEAESEGESDAGGEGEGKPPSQKND